MKRSVGVTVWAILLILAGILTGGAAIMSLSAGPRALDQLSEQMKQLEAMPTGTAQGQIPPEQLEMVRRQFEAFMGEAREAITSPGVRVSTTLSALLAIAAVLAGIGFFSLKGWARTVAIWQAGLSIPLGLYAAWFSPQQKLAGMMLRMYEGLMDPATMERMRQTMQAGQTVGQWLHVVILLAWNGLLIWFLLRASVKAQFVSSATPQRP